MWNSSARTEPLVLMCNSGLCLTRVCYQNSTIIFVVCVKAILEKLYLIPMIRLLQAL